MITIARTYIPFTDPRGMVYGPKVCLMNEFSASDGDLFPFRFKQHGIGKLIGKDRSWGGVVGIRGTLPLLDGGTLNRPSRAATTSRAETGSSRATAWTRHHRGHHPAREYAGQDQQLHRGIAEVLKRGSCRLCRQGAVEAAATATVAEEVTASPPAA